MLKPAILMAALALFSGCHKPQNNDVLVLVGDVSITVKDFQDRVREYELPPSSMAQDQRSEFKQRVLNEIIEEKVFLKAAREKNIEIPREELDSSLDKIRGDYSDADFDSLLKKKGMSMKELKERTKTNLLLERVAESLTDKVSKPSKENIESYYRDHVEDFYEGAKFQVSQIVVRTRDDARHVLDMLKKGTSFAQLAKTYSLTPEGNQGGDLGWISGGLPEPVLNALPKSTLNKPSEPIPSDYGFHIVLVRDKKNQRLVPLAEATPRIINVLTQQERENILSKWKQETFSKIKVVRNNALFASL